ncbi:MAG: 50S ribosomal protein L10 [Calditrichaeota bacterium]|nr:50S ribosomal protein L10 [Calditrichota bacterium]
MPTLKKEHTVAELTEDFKKATALYLADFSGMDMEITTKLRKSFAKDNVRYKVVKNTLALRALKNAGIEGLDAHLQGVTAIALTETDPTVPARVINDFNKNVATEKPLVLKACLFEGAVFGPDKVSQLADLPSREELLAKLLGTLKAPMSRLVGVLSAPMANTINTLTALKNKK